MMSSRLEDGDDLFLSVTSFFAAPTIGTYLYRALYNAPSSEEADGRYAALLLGRFSQTYSTSTATARSVLRRGGPIRRSDRPDISSTPVEQSPSSSSSSSSPVGAALGSELDGNSVFISPASRIIGRFHDLLELDCQQHYLCEYVDILRGKHDRLFVVAEHCERQLSALLSAEHSVDSVQRLAFELLVALNYLHGQGVVHRALGADSVHIDSCGHVKLSGYGMYYISQACSNVNFVLAPSSPRYLAPEALLSPLLAPSVSPKLDVWSFGVVLLEVLLGRPLFGDSDADQVSKEMDQLAQLFVADAALCQQRVSSLVQASSVAARLQSAPLLQLISAALTVDADERPTAGELLEHPWFAELHRQHTSGGHYPLPFVESLDRPAASALEQRLAEQRRQCSTQQFLQRSAFESLRDGFHFWQLCGCDLEREEQLRLPPPILRLPAIVRVDGSAYPHPAAADSTGEQTAAGRRLGLEPSLLPDTRTLLISLRALQQRLAHTASSPASAVSRSNEQLPPLSAREHDIEYQSFRVRLFRELLSKWPASRDQIVAQAKVDIPPLLRGQVWRRLLGVDDDSAAQQYSAVDKEAEGPFDHQIELDIPRCHQYHQLLSSPEGHSKLRRILRAWAAVNPTLSYWQGLDSLLAPFLVRNFSNEALAFACLLALTRGALRPFFGKSNTHYLQEHLLLFRQLLCYHDPELAVHLHAIGFEPELFGIPWFLTLFTHIFSLDKVYVIWDTLLLDPDRLPLFFGVSMLISLRAQLLQLDFNNALVFISNLPAIDLESCLRHTLARYERAAPSLSWHVPLCAADATDAEQGRQLAKAKACLVPAVQLRDVAAGSLAAPFLLLDIRRPADYKAAHIDGSINLNHKDPTLSWLEPYRKSDVVIVAYPANREQAIKFANGLVSPPHSFPYISILNADEPATDL